MPVRRLSEREWARPARSLKDLSGCDQQFPRRRWGQVYPLREWQGHRLWKRDPRHFSRVRAPPFASLSWAGRPDGDGRMKERFEVFVNDEPVEIYPGDGGEACPHAGARFVGGSTMQYEADPRGLFDAGFDAVILCAGARSGPSKQNTGRKLGRPRVPAGAAQREPIRPQRPGCGGRRRHRRCGCRRALRFALRGGDGHRRICL